jgi:signal transduction histidine kinase
LTIRRFLPSSLTGQIALLVALALFVAQAINFGLIFRERQALRFNQVTAPAITRVVDAIERLRTGRTLVIPRLDRRGEGGPERRGGRVELVSANPIPTGLAPARDVEDGLRTALTDLGLPHGRIVTAVREVDPRDPRFAAYPRKRLERLTRIGSELLIAVEVPGQGWLTLSTGWQRGAQGIVWRLAAQTLIFYIIVLIPLLWVGRRITKPLKSLATAAREFRPGEEAQPVEERGPDDVRAVIAAYNGMGARVTAMLDEKDRMLGAIGHDLRTPLAALRVRIESVDDDADRARMAEIIDEMNRMLDDILSLARLGRSSEPVTDVDLAALVDAVVEDFRDIGAAVTLEDSPRIRARTRPALMRRAVRNLIENAVKYAGGADVRISTPPGSVAIEVCDRGPGIPQDKLDAVFDPFTRLETSRNRDTGGIGLGLSLARAIVREAGGTIALVNRGGGGLIATITLPR